MSDDQRPDSISRWTRLNSRWIVGAFGAIAASVVLDLRIHFAGRGSPGRLVLLGRAFAEPGYRFAIHVYPGGGYDGQFYYRFALGPFHFSRTWSGITLDHLDRFNRIAYSVISWVVAGGRASFVPWSLLIVNVVGMGALAWLGASLAHSQGHHALWGLLLPAYVGFLWSLGRDLTEITETSFLVGALYVLRRRHSACAGVLLAVAVLSRETALGIVVALLIVDIARHIPMLAAFAQRHGRLFEDVPAGLTWTWILPLLTFVGWQSLVRAETGSFPILGSGQDNLGTPLVGLVDGLHHYLVVFPSHASFSWFGELLVLGVVAVRAARAVRDSDAPGYERLAWAIYVVMVLCLGKEIWEGDVGFRSMDDLYTVSCILLLGSTRLTADRFARYFPVLSVGAWLFVAAQIVKDI